MLKLAKRLGTTVSFQIYIALRPLQFKICMAITVMSKVLAYKMINLTNDARIGKEVRNYCLFPKIYRPSPIVMALLSQLCPKCLPTKWLIITSPMMLKLAKRLGTYYCLFPNIYLPLSSKVCMAITDTYVQNARL